MGQIRTSFSTQVDLVRSAFNNKEGILCPSDLRWQRKSGRMYRHRTSQNHSGTDDGTSIIQTSLCPRLQREEHPVQAKPMSYNVPHTCHIRNIKTTDLVIFNMYYSTHWHSIIDLLIRLTELQLYEEYKKHRVEHMFLQNAYSDYCGCSRIWSERLTAAFFLWTYSTCAAGTFWLQMSFASVT